MNNYLKKTKEEPEDKENLAQVPEQYYKYRKLFRKNLETGLPKHSK
jgi:hypothetical protein